MLGVQFSGERSKISAIRLFFSTNTFAGQRETCKLYGNHWETSAIQELPQNTTEFNQNIRSNIRKGPMESAILGTIWTHYVLN